MAFLCPAFCQASLSRSHRVSGPVNSAFARLLVVADIKPGAAAEAGSGRLHLQIWAKPGWTGAGPRNPVGIAAYTQRGACVHAAKSHGNEVGGANGGPVAEALKGLAGAAHGVQPCQRRGIIHAGDFATQVAVQDVAVALELVEERPCSVALPFKITVGGSRAAPRHAADA